MMLFGFALSVALFVSLGILIKAARASFMKPFPVAVDMIVQREGEPCEWAPVKLATNLNPIAQEKLEDIRGLAYVENASGILVIWAFTDLGDNKSAEKLPADNNARPPIPDSLPALKPLVVTGIDTSRLNLSPVGPKDIISGRFLKGLTKNETVLDAEFAKLVNKKVGDWLKLGNRDFRVAGIAGLVKDAGFRAQAYVDIETAQMMLDKGQVVNTILIKLMSGSGVGLNMKLMEKDIRDIVGASATITSTRDYFIMLGQVSQAERIYLVTFFLISVIIAGLFISKSIFSYIGEKLRDVGTLKAIGWSQASIIRLIVYENAFLGIVGGVMGSIAGYFLTVLHKARSLNLPYFLNPIPPCNVTGADVTFTLVLRPSLYVFLFAIIISSLLGIILGYLAGLKISRVNAASALRSL